MQFEPQTENGKRVLTMVKNRIDKSAAVRVDELKRILLVCSLKLKNEDAFVTLLYGQGVLEGSPSVLVKPNLFSVRKKCENNIIIIFRIFCRVRVFRPVC